jgi:hypothetical protein
MQVVSAVVFRKQLRGLAWVTQDGIEVDHTIEFTTTANPVVDLLPYGFPLGSIKSGNQPFEEFSNGGFVVPITRTSFRWPRAITCITIEPSRT